MRRLHSIQLRLLAYLSAGVALVWLAASVWTWLDARHELDELLDSHLTQAAALLVVQQAHADDDADEVEAPVLHKYATRVAFQVFHEGVLVQRSANMGSTPLGPQTQGFATVQMPDGTEWRVFATQGAQNDVQVYVGEQLSARNGILWAVMRGLALPSLLALPFFAMLMWWAVHRALEPLAGLGAHLRRRTPQSTTPVELDNLPTEMRPMVDELNGLLLRIDAMVASERRFTADAAHELRTPIAAIRAQAQVALGAGDNEAERRHALDATVAGCDRATRLVDQLLTLARLDAPTQVGTSSCDLAVLARSVAAEQVPVALASGQELELLAPESCAVMVDEVLLRMLLRNVLDNAIRYAGAGARIVVTVEALSDSARLQVSDSGPGMDDADMARLGERFFRVLGSGQPGSGLGWSIVRRIAKATGAQVAVGRSPQLGGLQVELRWPTS